MDGPPDDAGIVGVVSQEGDGRGDGLDAAVQRGGQEGKGAALAFTPGHHAVGIGFIQRGGEIHGLLHVAESAAVVERITGSDAAVDPAALALLEDALVPYAYQEFDAVRTGRRVHVVDIGPVAHVVDADGILAGRVGNADDTARDGPAIGRIRHMIGGAEFIGMLRNRGEDGLQGNTGEFLQRSGPEAVEVLRGVGRTHHLVGAYADIPAKGIPQADLVKARIQGTQRHMQGAVGRDGNIGPENHLWLIGHQGTVCHQFQGGGTGSGIHVCDKGIRSLLQEQPAQLRIRRTAGYTDGRRATDKQKGT